MNLEKIFKLTVFIFSFAMLVYQCSIGLQRLLDPSTNEVVEMLDISEVDLPDIYVCPDNQYNLTAIRAQRYSDRNVLLFGSPSKSLMYSWGAHMNKTFEEILNEILPDILPNNNANPRILESKKYITEKVYIARYGFCIRVRGYNYEKLSIYTRNQTNKVYVLIADKFKHTFPNPSFSSRSGDMIFLSPGTEKWYTNKVSLISNEDPLKKKSCQHYGSDLNTYENCVDKSVSNTMMTGLGCNPPYLSMNNICNTLFEKEDYSRVRKFYRKIDYWNLYLMKLIDLEPMTIQDNCTDPCLTTHVDVNLHSEGPPVHPKPTFARVNLSFKKEVEKRSRVISYDFYNFLIDIGSSLGLWLGISVFSLTDIALQMVNSMRSCMRWSKI